MVHKNLAGLALGLMTVFVVSQNVMAAVEADENVVVCKEHRIQLTVRGDIAVLDKNSKVLIYLPILHENQLIQNDNNGLNLMASKKRLGMILSQQKVQIDYRTGQGTAEDRNLAGNQDLKKVELKSCRRSS